MKTVFFAGIGLAATLLIIFFLLPPKNTPERVDLPPALSGQTQAAATETPAVPTETASPTLSPKEANLAEARRLAAEYDRAVKAEIQAGGVEIRKDMQSGKEVFFFEGEAMERILHLYDELNVQLQKLNEQYLALYIAEVQPTPFPTKSSETENENYYQDLLRQYPDFFDQILAGGPVVPVYNPDDGTYNNRVIGDAYAKSEVMTDAIEAFHQAPQLAKVNQAAQTAHIRDILDQPDLPLTFDGVSNLANAPWISTAVYVDEAGTRYSVAIDRSRLAAIEPASRIEVPAIEVKPIEAVRLLAENFALEHSPNYTAMKDDLQYEEGGKGDIYFFTWRMQNKDWSGTSWEMMPPFLQIGMSADGKIVTFNDTLDLYDEK